MAGTGMGVKPGETESFQVKNGTTVTNFAALVQSGTTEGECDLPAAKNDPCIGIAMYAQAEDKMVAVIKSGTYWAKANVTLGGAIVPGDKLIIADTSGRLMKDDTASGAVAYIVGTARTPASADNDELIVAIELDEYQIA